ncbi:neprilysin-2-like [Amblyomma americanum]
MQIYQLVQLSPSHQLIDGPATNVSGSGEVNSWLAAFNAALGDKGNLSADEPLFVADPRLFALTREVLERYPTRHVRYYAAFHVVRQLAPYTSYRLVDAMFAPENQTAAMVYYADACAAAASRLTSFALASYVFQNLVQQQQVQAAYDQLDALKNRTAGLASAWLAQPDQPWALQRLNAIKSMVAWPARLNGSSATAVDQFLAHLPDFRGYYVEIYFDAVAAIRNHEKAQLLDRTNGSVENKIAREEDGPFPGLRPTVRYSPWYGSILVSPSAILEPLFVNGSDSASLGAFGHLAAHELWHAALGEMPLGVSPQSDLTLGEETLKRHECVANVYKKAGANKRDAEKGSSENVADVVGLELAYSVYREGNASAPASGSSGGEGNATDIRGLNPDRLFFLASCLKWCSATPDTLSKTSLGYTTPRLRCNVPVAMLDAGSGFAEAFGCKPESKMVKMTAGPKCMAIVEQPMDPPRTYNVTG